MAKSCSLFTSLQEQTKCPVCWDAFTQPKLLVCNHAFCKRCIDHLPVDIDQGNYVVKCPTCRKQTTLPQHNATNLPPAFHIDTLVEVYAAARQVKSTIAASTVDVPKEVSCPKHGRPLDMYCDDCQQVVCAKCFHDDHRNHKCDFVADLISKSNQEINDHLATIKQQIGNVLNALDNINAQEKKIIQQGEAVKNQIDTLVGEIIEAVQQSGRQLKENVDNLVQLKLSNISRQKEYGEMLLTQFKSCQEYVEDKVHNGSQQEIMSEKNEMIERMRAASQESILQELQIKEKADILFRQSHIILKKCKIGEVSINAVTTDTTTATSKPHAKLDSKVAIVGKHRIIDINVPNISRLCHNLLCCTLVFDKESKKSSKQHAKIEHIGKEKCRISFTPTHPGLHRIKVQAGTMLKCNPCTIRVLPATETTCQLVRALHDIKQPHKITTSLDHLLVITKGRNVAAVSKEGHFIKEFHDRSTDVCITPDNHILVLSSSTPHVTKYTTDYAMIGTGNTGADNGSTQLCSIAAGSSHVYVCDMHNNCIHVLHTDLTFSHTVGGKGSGSCQFLYPHSIAVDSQDTLYVSDRAEMVEFKSYQAVVHILASSKVQPDPSSMAIDCNDIIYIQSEHQVLIYDSNGDHFGSVNVASGYERCTSLAVDDRHIYVCHHDTHCDSYMARVFKSINNY